MPQVDWLILTAANRAQARGYNAQLRARAGDGVLASVANWRVIPDPGDRRVGSGGSTLFVLYELARELLARNPAARSLAELFAGQRILVIHSGGDSRRLVAYAAQGKIFTPLPCNAPGERGRPATLFDLVAANLIALPAPPAGQVLLASGDVLLTFYRQEVDFARPGVVGVAYPGPLERGSKHGVYVADREGKVTDFLQKPDAEAARRHGAVDPVGRVLVDTGLVNLDPPTVECWLTAAGVQLGPCATAVRGCARRPIGARHGRGRPCHTDAPPHQIALAPGLLRDILSSRAGSIDLYEQILMALPPAQNQAAYLQAVLKPGGNRGQARQAQRLASLYQALHGRPFHVNVLPYCEFFHIGSSRELLYNVGTLSRTAKVYGFANFDRAVVADRAALEGAFVYNSILRTPALRAGQGVLLEATHTQRPVELAGRNLVVGFPAAARTPLRLPEGWGLVCLPVRAPRTPGGPGNKGRRPYAVVLFGIDDDFKTPRERSGTFGNRPLGDFLADHHLAPADLWPAGAPQTLWDARLWTIGPIDQVLAATLWMCHRGAAASAAAVRSRGVGRGASSDRPNCRRVSMAQLLGMVDHDRLIADRAEIQRLGELYQLSARLSADPWLPAARIVAHLANAGEAAAALTQVFDLLAGTEDALAQARWCKLAQMIVERFPRLRVPRPSSAVLGGQLASTPAGDGRGTPTSSSLQRAAFAAVARSVAQHLALPRQPRPAAILPDQVVWAATPVRIDLAGGWSDTPPLCAELGGTVLNAAITLNGQYPVQVIAKFSDRPTIALSSMDLGRRVELADTAAVLRYQDPTDWAALPKAALVLSGIAPRDPRQTLSHWLKKLGGGLDLTFFSAVPKGSGLGTSSVLGAAMLACLARVVGERLPQEQLIARTSLLEQLMTTGGGWQDQVGGITPGAKLIRTQPGPDQTPSLHATAFDLSPRGPLHGRLLLYYTGYKRMARDILHKVVGRYFARDPQALRIVERLKAGAEQMKSNLDAGDVAAFGRGIEEYWRLKQEFDPGSTNPTIEALIRPVARYLFGKVLPGAGGGGFVFMVARDPEAAQRVRRYYRQNPPNPLARFFDFAIDPAGLAVTVL